MSEEKPTEGIISTIIGPFSINLLQDGSVEFRTFNQTDKNTLTAEQTFTLLDWLYNYREMLYQRMQQGKQEESE